MSSEQLKLRCAGCGAQLEYSATDSALKCPYCGKTTDIPRAKEDAPDAAEAVIPLIVDVTNLTDAVYRYLASGDMTPDYLLEHASITRKDRFYVPAFCFRGSFDAKWTASFGYDRIEHYTEYESRYENGRNVRVPVNKTRTVTDWRPVNGLDTGEFAVRAYAGVKLLDSSLHLTGLVEGGAAQAAPYDVSYVSGFDVEGFQHTESDVFNDRGQVLVNDVIDISVQSHAQGDRQKDWHWTADLHRESVPTLVPICHAMYEFEGKEYNIWLSGFDASRIVADPLPVDNGRQRAARISFAPLLAAIAGAGTAIFFLGSFWLIPLATVAAAGVYGMLRRKAIIGYSHKVRQTLLARRQSTNSANAAASTDAAKSRPWLANTANDKIVVPLIALAFAAVPLGSALIWHKSPDAQSEPATAQVARYDSSTSGAPQSVATPSSTIAPAQGAMENASGLQARGSSSDSQPTGSQTTSSTSSAQAVGLPAGQSTVDDDATSGGNTATVTGLQTPSVADFAKYRQPAYTGTPVYPDFLGAQRKYSNFRTRIRGSLRDGVNFAGHYVIVTFGCGTQCVTGYITDIETGQVYDMPLGGESYPELNIAAKPDSSLLVARYVITDPKSFQSVACEQDLILWKGGVGTIVSNSRIALKAGSDGEEADCPEFPQGITAPLPGDSLLAPGANSQNVDAQQQTSQTDAAMEPSRNQLNSGATGAGPQSSLESASAQTKSSSRDRSLQVAADLVGKGQMAFEKQDYSTAIANAKAALDIRPGYVRAEHLLQDAQQAQQQAMNSISIH